MKAIAAKLAAAPPLPKRRHDVAPLLLVPIVALVALPLVGSLST